ncbi:Leucine Rich repeats (2 copies) [Carpediemonas membranifera]|uniref:Leucine Rich repeats (2 copies) n=1 Tax=Carpediemonas membranifera TaxID=201153 RepID=A0A8J6B741_9EUKA|nr:Leucine Rich repeats (2 copies) [Carpediemonas membranifera]|eukprot:KAG9395659.1 Leucine Rich repeats (2 copies) [Carpediemonas membranifera]
MSSGQDGHLDQSNMELTSIDDFAIPRYITSLSLANNNLTSLTGNNAASAIFRNLQSLDLSFNNITDVQPLAFCHSLVELDLSHNEIRRVTCLETLVSLQVLDLSHNKIDNFLTIRAIALSPRLKHLSLEGNPICQSPKFAVTVRSQLTRLETLDGALVRGGSAPAAFSPTKPKVQAVSPLARTTRPNPEAVAKARETPSFVQTRVRSPERPSASSRRARAELSELDEMLREEREAASFTASTFSRRPQPHNAGRPAPLAISPSSHLHPTGSEGGVPSFVERLHSTHTASSRRKVKGVSSGSSTPIPIEERRGRKAQSPGPTRARSASRIRPEPTPAQRQGASFAQSGPRIVSADPARQSATESRPRAASASRTTASPRWDGRAENDWNDNERPGAVPRDWAPTPRKTVQPAPRNPAASRRFDLELSELDVIGPPTDSTLGLSASVGSALHASQLTERKNSPIRLTPRPIDISQPTVDNPPSPIACALTSLRAGSVALSAQMSFLKSKIRGLDGLG